MHMKSFIFLSIALLSFSVSVTAQTDSWKIYLNKKMIGRGQEPHGNDTVKISIKKSQIAGKNMLRIDYTEATSPKNWKRTFLIYDGNNELANFDFDTSSGMFGISMKKIGQLLAEHKNILLYSFSEPKDKQLASAIRIRRIFMCELRIKN